MKNTLYLILLTILISGCANHTTNKAIPKNNKIKKHIHSSKDGHKHAHKNELKKSMSKIKLCKDKEKIEVMNRVGKQLASVIKDKNIRWKFTLIENDTINATCFPNGHIIMTSGVFDAARNDAEIATVIAHEMAHVVAKHGKARINRANLLNGIEGAGVIIAGLINPLAIIPFVITYEVGTKHAIIYPKSKQEEEEADQIGLKLMQKANFDINSAYNLWCNIKEINKDKKVKKSTTHFSYDTRIKQIQCEIDKIKEENKIVLNLKKQKKEEQLQ